jgi:hypothetical protein
VSSNNRESIAWFVVATHSKGDDGREVVDDKILSRRLHFPTFFHVEFHKARSSEPPLTFSYNMIRGGISIHKCHEVLGSFLDCLQTSRT